MPGASHRKNDLCQFLYMPYRKNRKNCVITEDCEFSPGLVDGDYAKKSKAAVELVFSAAQQGLNVSIVFPPESSVPVMCQAEALHQWQRPFLPGSCPLPCAAV